MAEPMPAVTSSNYTQTNKELTLQLPLGAGVRAKQVRFHLTSNDIEVGVGETDLIRGKLFLPVRPDDSSWEIEDTAGGRELRVVLCKARPNQQWDVLMLAEVDEAITHRTFMDVSIGGGGARRVVFGLHGRAAPRTCENFRCLCTGEKGSVRLRKKQSLELCYKGCLFHRVVPGFLCQGGDVSRDPQGRGGYSIYGQTFEDEGFRIKHTGARSPNAPAASALGEMARLARW